MRTRRRLRERAREIERRARTGLSLCFSFLLLRRRPPGPPETPGISLPVEPLSRGAYPAPTILYDCANLAPTAAYDALSAPEGSTRAPKGTPIPSRSPRYLRQGRAYICARCGARYRVLDSARKHFRRKHE